MSIQPQSSERIAELRTACTIAMTLLISASAWAQPVEVVAGEDLTAWRQLQHSQLQGAAAADAYRAFIDTYPTSSLSEVAWARLQELDAPAAAGAPQSAQLERSAHDHARNLRRVEAGNTVARLEADGTRPSTPGVPWSGVLVAGGGYDGQHASGGLGFGIGKGPVMVLARFQRGATWVAEGDLRFALPIMGPIFVEAGFDSRIWGNARAGLSFHLPANLLLEGSAGVAFSDQQVGPMVRLEVGYRLF